SSLTFVLIPTKEQVYDFLKINHQDLNYLRFNKLLSKFFITNDIDYIDLLPAFLAKRNNNQRDSLNKNDLYFNLDAHWNENGNELAYKIIYTHIASSINKKP
ncbi:MAG: hypothetical protein OEX07_16350, partial [Gammaproteobacteria bacterium]|nr:hypothetical protein [Gammaproteobacteria bacterium]